MYHYYSGIHRYLDDDDRLAVWNLYGIPPPTISGPGQICTSATYQVNNLPTGATVTWSVTPIGRVSLQSSGNNVIITKVSDGAITLTANINTSSSTLTQPIHVGKPNYWGTITDLNNPSLAYGLGGQYITFTFIPNAPAPILGAITGYQWGYYKAVSAGNNITIIQSGNTTSNTWSVGISEPVGKYVVYVNPYNSCGTFEMNNMAVITIGNPSGPDPELPYFIVPPSNPTNSVINGKK
jgi:hypothetical protein